MQHRSLRHPFALRRLIASGAVILSLALATAPADAQQTRWVQTGTTGRLVYVPDSDGDRILDFSMAGYGAGKAPIPNDLPVVIRIDPISGDNTQHIQNAINYASSLPLQANGFRGVVELGPGKFNVHDRLRINASGVVLRGSGAGSSVASNTHLVSQNRTDSMDAQATAVIEVQGGTGITRGPQIQIIDKRVPVGAQSFRVASTSGLTVGGMVEIFRPSTQAWIEELGMHLIPDGKHWRAGDRDLTWHRTITRIEGNRVFIDAPVTTALDTQWGGGTVRTFDPRNIIRNVGVENLRGQSLDNREETNEFRTPSFVRFRRVEDGWVRDVQTRHFPFASVFTAAVDGTRHISVDNVDSRLPSGQVSGGRRYTFAMNAQYSLVTNSSAQSGRHDFVTAANITGPIVFHNSTTSDTRSDSGPHHRWASGLLFDNITVGGNAINVRNRWDSGGGHGWAGANVVVWNSAANSFIVQNPPTAQNWLIGSTGTVIPGECHLGGATCAGYHDSHGTRVTVGGSESLYEAQLQDAADLRDFRWTGGIGTWSEAARWNHAVTPAVYRVSHRDYLLGDIDGFTYDGPMSDDDPYVDPAWLADIILQDPLPVTGYDDLGGNRHVAFTIQHQLDPGERVLHAALALSLQQSAAGSADDDFVRLFDTHPDNRLTFSQLGWAPHINPAAPFVGVIDLGGHLDRLQSGAVNVQVSRNTGVDWAMYLATVATPISDAAGPRVFLDGGGILTLDHVPSPIGSLQIGGGDGGNLALTPDARLPVTGDVLVLTGGTLQLEIDGTDRSTPRLHAAGLAQLGGTLQIGLWNGFAPVLGDAFELLAADAGILDTFQQLLLPTIDSSLDWNILYGATTVSLHVVAAALPGDFNGDGVVDAADYILWRKMSGTPAEYETWRANFGAMSAAAASGAAYNAVPEPAAAVLVLSWAVAYFCFRRSHRPL